MSSLPLSVKKSRGEQYAFSSAVSNKHPGLGAHPTLKSLKNANNFFHSIPQYDLSSESHDMMYFRYRAVLFPEACMWSPHNHRRHLWEEFESKGAFPSLNLKNLGSPINYNTHLPIPINYNTHLQLPQILVIGHQTLNYFNIQNFSTNALGFLLRLNCNGFFNTKLEGLQQNN